MSYAEVEMKIVQWAEARRIIPHAKPHTQLMKAVSEMGELCDAELKGDMDGVKDGVADVVICLINYCALKDIDLVSCLHLGYDQIKHRRGHMTPDGTFVKAGA
jgi:NTP pyrophosphatase (non-canonical NTP hydrolase)